MPVDERLVSQSIAEALYDDVKAEDLPPADPALNFTQAVIHDLLRDNITIGVLRNVMFRNQVLKEKTGAYEDKDLANMALGIAKELLGNSVPVPSTPGHHVVVRHIEGDKVTDMPAQSFQRMNMVFQRGVRYEDLGEPTLTLTGTDQKRAGFQFWSGCDEYEDFVAKEYPKGAAPDKPEPRPREVRLNQILRGIAQVTDSIMHDGGLASAADLINSYVGALRQILEVPDEDNG